MSNVPTIESGTSHLTELIVEFLRFHDYGQTLQALASEKKGRKKQLSTSISKAAGAMKEPAVIRRDMVWQRSRHRN